MEKMSILTPTQKRILDQIKNSEFIKKNFYFTGGTVLSEFYLQHRFSEDLDFFSEKKFDFDKIFEEVNDWSKKLDFTFTRQQREVVHIYILNLKNKDTLKLDFGYYPYPRVKKGIKYQGLTVDSLLDIAINKLASVNQRNSVKDFVDLYYLLDKFTIWDLIEGVKMKFRMEIEPWILGSDLEFVVKDFQTLPKMIKPLTLNELKNFFRQKAQELGKKSVI
ncbi:hypothetical protein AUJ27_01060 [Candidatus Falkowbacteria bacterium CG1_02_37_44]|uniref:Nucleotidyl transferase AbiEii/AbiGii toxin family protein n=2 Tax=Patescibacteria group TaxID=1783273 RepID=A0A1J4T9K5_9BACT|nr:MAG: hypothetical protein AUJ27_01060 [Candidatus Falkowbacteria bacterium CG1_02_37_44]PJC33402.1 MAG: hypothetical protein CO048_03185 [Candidatus Roizmanbacteria bacterium CG_4_9_14_0_2_um_filter_35_15]